MRHGVLHVYLFFSATNCVRKPCHTYHTYSSHNIGFLPSDKRLELQEVHGELDIFLEIDLSVQQVFALILQN